VSGSGFGLPSNTNAVTLVTGTITKGKHRTVVAIEGMLTAIGNNQGPRVDQIWPTINGVIVEPEFGGQPHLAEVNCPTMTFPSTSFCTTTGTWWLDIDAAEAANPGMFIGKALTITLMGAETTGNGDSALSATLTARVEKK
jgi:hypothetical protein